MYSQITVNLILDADDFSVVMFMKNKSLLCYLVIYAHQTYNICDLSPVHVRVKSINLDLHTWAHCSKLRHLSFGNGALSGGAVR